MNAHDIITYIIIYNYIRVFPHTSPFSRSFHLTNSPLEECNFAKKIRIAAYYMPDIPSSRHT